MRTSAQSFAAAPKSEKKSNAAIAAAKRNASQHQLGTAQFLQEEQEINERDLFTRLNFAGQELERLQAGGGAAEQRQQQQQQKQ
jgi:hypothetical protein